MDFVVESGAKMENATTGLMVGGTRLRYSSRACFQNQDMEDPKIQVLSMGLGHRDGL